VLSGKLKQESTWNQLEFEFFIVLGLRPEDAANIVVDRTLRELSARQG